MEQSEINAFVEQSTIHSELRQLQSRLGAAGAEMDSGLIIQTLRKLPPGVLKREGSDISFTPHPPKKPGKAERQGHLRFRLRAQLALMDS